VLIVLLHEEPAVDLPTGEMGYNPDGNMGYYTVIRPFLY
jgi:hypothetical protein